MASRCRSLASPSISLLKSALRRPTTLKPPPSPSPPLLSPRPSPTSRVQGSVPALGSLHSLLPLYSAVSSARLTSCLGIDPTSSRSMCQELGLSVPR